MKTWIIIWTANPAKWITTMRTLDIRTALNKLKHHTTLWTIVYEHIIQLYPIFHLCLLAGHSIVLFLFAFTTHLLATLLTTNNLAPPSTFPLIQYLFTVPYWAKEEVLIHLHPLISLKLFVFHVTIFWYYAWNLLLRRLLPTAHLRTPYIMAAILILNQCPKSLLKAFTTKSVITLIKHLNFIKCLPLGIELA